MLATEVMPPAQPVLEDSHRLDDPQNFYSDILVPSTGLGPAPDPIFNLMDNEAQFAPCKATRGSQLWTYHRYNQGEVTSLGTVNITVFARAKGLE